MKVTKRNGTLEELDYSKIDNHLEYACQGLDNAHPSEIEMNAVIQFNDGMSTDHIQDILIQSAINLAQTKQQYIVAAGRLYLQQLRKQAYGKYWNPPTIKEHINKNMFNSRYSLKLLQYSAYELEELEKVVNHSLDEQMGYAAIKTYGDKYLLSTKRNGDVFETPQMANILRFMTGLVNVPNRLERIKKIYKIYNENKFSLASPTMRAMRTNTEQYNSCAVMKLDDNLESFDAVNGSILALSSKMYGLGLDGSSIRRLGADIRNGEAVHTGSVNFIKMFEATLNSCSQGGMRKGSMTYYFPIWHYDVQDLVMLRDHGGTDETRCRTLNYAVQMHGLFWKKFLNDEEIVLFSPHDVKDLYEAFFKPAYPNQFEELYELYSNDESIPKRKIEARILMSTVAQQMYQTGKLFIANVDLMNSHTPFKDDAIYSSNLCVAPDTKVLTKDYGNIEIEKVAGQYIEAWTGTQWVDTQFAKTGERKKLLTVTLSNGAVLNVTPEHKWCVAKFNKFKENVGFSFIETKSLNIGDKLNKYSYDICHHGTQNLSFAYENGFYTGDGTLNKNTKVIYLYGKKKLLFDKFKGYYNSSSNTDRISLFYKKDLLQEKYWIPTNEFTIESRLNWLSGLFDADGTITNNNGAQSIQLASINKVFLNGLRLMLAELGIISKIVKGIPEGYCNMPLNDGIGGYGNYLCNETNRLIISGVYCNKLLDLGFHAHRVMPSKHNYNRESTAYVKVVSIEDNGIVSDTYCGNTSNDEHTLIFNGVMTGNCMEIALPTKPIVNTKNDPDALISLCTLAAVNWSAHKSVEELDDTMDSLVEFLNEGLHSQQSYLVPAKNSTDWYAPLGIGINNFAHFMAKNDLRYGEPNALSVVHEWVEATYYYALKASVNYAKQNPDRVPSKIDRTIYSEGSFVFEKSKLQERFPELCSDWTLKQNWDDLSFDMCEYGIANATVLAMMPGETSSVVQQMTNSLEGVNFDKASTSGNLKFVPQDYDLLKNKFQKMFEISNDDYLKTTAVIQKFTDQAISTNLYYTRDENDMNDVDELLHDMLLAYMLGNKTIYYTNTRSSSEHMYKEQETAEQECEGCSI